MCLHKTADGFQYLHNIDCDSTIFPFLEKVAARDSVTEADLYPFIDELLDTNVTDVYLNVNAQCSVSPSAVFDDIMKNYEKKVENGIPVDYTKILWGPYRVMKECGIDPFAVWFRRIREIGRRSHLSIRMNDCHCPDEETCWLRTDLFYIARENGWMNGPAQGYYRCTLNYRVPEVRKYFLDYIREQLFRYDVDGLELDFMRERICFDYTVDPPALCVSIMNDFIREVKALVKEAEEKYGHSIEITARMPRDLEKSLAFGFDCVTWEKEGLVDRIIPSPRFQGSDTHLPIAAWKAALPKTKITACIESLVSSDWGMSRNGLACMTAEMVRGNAASYLAQGSDGIYTFNLFGQGCGGGEIEIARDYEVQKTIGSYEETVRHSLRFVTIPEDFDSSPAALPRWLPVPTDIEDVWELPYVTGKLPPDKKGKLLIGLSAGSIEDVSVSVNGKPYTDFAVDALPYPANVAEKDSLIFSTPLSLSEECYTVRIEKRGEAKVRLSWVEIDAR